jgi:hypothetical protein
MVAGLIHDPTEDCQACMNCRNNRPFQLPDEVVEACLDGKLIVFAGAGISTENRAVFPDTFYEEIVHSLDATGSDLTFPQAMTGYTNKYGRSDLLQRIKHRFDYIESFPELSLWASRFHVQLSTIYLIRDIVTTNWDTLFENFTGAIPIVTPEDYAFWDLPERKVFKIHGSINNVGTVVATEKDYNQCYKRLRAGVIGSSLRHLLATKTALFVGYSFGDADFNRLYGYLKREMGDILPRSFIVTIDERITPETHKGSTIIYTDGAFFLGGLKKKLVEQKIMFPDSHFEGLREILDRVNEANRDLFVHLPYKENPAVIYAASYQDGLRHILQRILIRRRTGEYSDPHHLFHRLDSYERLRRGALKAKKYFDVAYIEGYLNGMMCLAAPDEWKTDIPIYFVFGSKAPLDDLETFLAEHDRAAQLHRTAFAAAKKTVDKTEDSHAVYHTPFLGGVTPA